MEATRWMLQTKIKDSVSNAFQLFVLLWPQINFFSYCRQEMTTKLTLYADDTVLCSLHGWVGVGRAPDLLRCFAVWCLIKLLTGLLSLLFESQSRCHFICKTEILWFVFYSEHYFASVTCGSFHWNQASKYVLANKRIELNIVFSLKADALIFSF